MDLRPQRYQTWEELSGYIWKVACAVGLISIRIFGCTSPGSEHYAKSLGLALQLTNILRDVQEDYINGQRIYLPMEDLIRFQYTENDLRSQVRDERFIALMNFEATRAENFYQEAIAFLPKTDSNALIPAQIMGEIYQRLLAKMREDQFRVFNKRYRVSKLRKLVILSKHLVAPKHRFG
jgi:phytoene synthase